MQINTEKDLKLFFDSHYRQAVVQSTRIVNHQTAAEDIVQECMMKIWDKRSELKAETSSSYFKTMVRNKSIDYLRAKKHQTQELESDQFGFQEHDNLEYAELVEKVNHVIDGLPDRCKEIFVLSRFEQMTYKQIAEKLSISIKTVENQMSKALKVVTSLLP